MLKLKPLLSTFLKCEVGNGTVTAFWWDSWTTLGPFIDFVGTTGPRMLRLRLDARAADAVQLGSWRLPNARSDAVQALQIHLTAISPPQAGSGEDTYLWRLPSGIYSKNFSSKGTWEQLRVRSLPVSWAKTVWFTEEIPRASFILWAESTAAASIHSGHNTASPDFYLGAHHHADEVAATSHGLRSVERAECTDLYHNEHANTCLEGCSGPHGSRSSPFLPFAGWHSFSSRIIFCLYLISVMINFGLFHMCGNSLLLVGLGGTTFNIRQNNGNNLLNASSTRYDDHISFRAINKEEKFHFPKDFLFGTASSAYQYEGAYLTDGKSLSNWDVFTEIPGKIEDGSNGKVAIDHYHRYPGDLDLLKDLGVDSYRFSLSWARILPRGRFGDVNMEGINHYNRVINAVLERGMEPFVTLTHYDIPQELEVRYRSWLSPQIREDFVHYAEICFQYFGDRVKFWTTFNEPNVQVLNSYRTGEYPPSRCSKPFGNCTRGNSDIEPLVAAHNIIRSHLAAVYTYRMKYQEEQRGKIGLVMSANWFEPEDLDLMKDLGVNSYRFSLSWARILPKGRFGDVNMEGIDHYNRMINATLEKGMEPFVTLAHFDIPQELEVRYGSWLNPQIREDFVHYAEICFRYFGNRVKFWTTFNGPYVQVICSYRTGTSPPSRCSKPFGNCTRGDSYREPLVAAHNIIPSHLAAVNIYRMKYQEEQRGKIGLVMSANWFEPVSDSLADRLAAERAQAFYLTWFLDPVVYGRYPKEMQEILGEDLPKFTKDDLIISKNGLDFIGLNQYTGRYAKDCLHSACEPGKGGSKAEGFVYTNALKDGLALGEPTSISWLHVYPQGMEKVLMYATERYNNIPLYVAENGYGENITVASLNDHQRIKFMSSYLDALKRAMRKGADVRGYFTWSILDSFEWVYGYTSKFGLYHVDFDTLERTPRLSASWYKNFIFKNRAQSKEDDA
ncbi:unnamed protein product [Microthlaspi erraticum]|uniref:beta-glucosidase n=1 Tax=Microthlaspi erraticum TaxID=1685480 RepID=A0A6D2KQQ5_9BRAS|nr:unnamed protein product [Microthlaspi erraticum]